MKKSILFAGLLMVSALFIGCNNDHSPETSSTKLWPAAMVSKDAQGIPTSKWGYIDAKGNFAIPASYMEAYDFSGKTVIPFATSGGSSIKKACDDLSSTYSNINWKAGKLLNGMTKKELEEWVKEDVSK